MAQIDLQSFLNFTGIEIGEDMTQEQLHEQFQNTFVKRDNATQDDSIVKSVIGKHLGTLDTNVRKIARENGVDIPEELKTAKIEDVLSHTFKGLKKTHETKIGELQAQMDNADVDAIRTEYEDRYSKLENKYQDTIGLLNDTKSKFESFKEERDGELKNFKLSTILSNHYSDAKYKSGITDVEKLGFKTYMDNTYATDLDENGNAFMFSRQTGERIKNEKKMGEFMTIPEVIDMELSKQSLLSVNDKAESKTQSTKKLGSSLQDVKAPAMVEHAQRQGRVLNKRASR